MTLYSQVTTVKSTRQGVVVSRILLCLSLWLSTVHSMKRSPSTSPSWSRSPSTGGTSPDGRSRKKALIIGFDYQAEAGTWYGEEVSKLTNPHDCADEMEMLLRNLDYQTKTFTDSEGAFTNEEFLGVLEQFFVTDARPGDTLFFYYAGHGAPTRDYTCGDDYGEGECAIVLGGYEGCFLKFQMNEVFNQMDQKLAGVTVLTVLDCCHAAGIIDASERQGSENIYINFAGCAADAKSPDNKDLVSVIGQCSEQGGQYDEGCTFTDNVSLIRDYCRSNGKKGTPRTVEQNCSHPDLNLLKFNMCQLLRDGLFGADGKVNSHHEILEDWGLKNRRGQYVNHPKNRVSPSRDAW